MNNNRIKNVIFEILNEYFQRLDKSKKEIKSHSNSRKILSKLDEEKIDEKLMLLFNDSIIVNTQVDDYSGISESCKLKNTDAIDFTSNFNSEDKKIKLILDFEDSSMLDCKKEIFNPEVINERCDIEIRIKRFFLVFTQLSDKHHITIFIKEGEILKIKQSNDNWLNSNLFEKDVSKAAKTTNTQKDQLSKNKGCMSFFSFFV